jgi:hypothetical protein
MSADPWTTSQLLALWFSRHLPDLLHGCREKFCNLTVKRFDENMCTMKLDAVIPRSDNENNG